MYLIGGTAGIKIARDLSDLLSVPLAKITIKRFPDDELYIRILDDIANEHVVIVQSTYPDTKIVELLLLENAAFETGAKKITVVLPYYGYSRQDKKFQNGEAISAKALAQHIQVHADNIITVDPHKEHILDFFTIPAYYVSANHQITTYLEKKSIDYLIAPDEGAFETTKDAAAMLGCKCDYLEKKRRDGHIVEMKPKTFHVAGKTVAILDDIISTGGTMALAIKKLKEQGARTVYAVCTHGLFIHGADKKLLDAGCDEIISTDTVENKYDRIAIAPCVKNIINKIK